ncbi:MAG TPA: Smr/MutS family protein, partial [Symbiobacteriaceae bacterium]|nr:Smr/MutS family protein [Symbiobacteriaceae bacterium]
FTGAQEKAHDVVEKARVQAQNVLAQARREAEAVIEELKAAVKEQREAERNQAIQGARQRLTKARAGLEDGRPARKARQGGEAPKGLKPGDAVLILPMDSVGYVLTPPDSQGNVQVQAGILKVNIPLTDLERAEDPNAAKQQAPKPASSGTRSSARGAAKAQEISTEVDLRGLMVEEALDKVDKYLDDAVLGGAPFVRIIHGKGTGALRKAVTDFLKADSRVVSHRLGGVGEGGDGVTVARLSD